MTGDGDGWVYCAAGHRHWGRFGAAGLLLSDGDRAILQHRAPWTHEGGTWALPGGARDSHEDATSAALREAHEEAAIDAESVEPVATWVDDHGGWSYTTVLARPRGPIDPHAANAESTEVRWWSTTEIDRLPLHHGLRAAWPHLRQAPVPLAVVVDTRADSRFRRWTDGDVASWAELAALVRRGIAATALPDEVDVGGVASMLAHIAVVGDVQAPARAQLASWAGWWQRGCRLVAAGADAGATVLLATTEEPRNQVVVVTHDSNVLDRLTGTTPGLGSDWLVHQLEASPTS